MGLRTSSDPGVLTRGGIGSRTNWAQLGPTVATSALSFLLVLYLALKGGGYDAVIRSEVGIAVWWVVMCAAVAGLIPRTLLTRGGRVAVTLLGVFTAWMVLSLVWTESAERTVAEISRLAAYVGVFVLAISVQGRGGLRLTLWSVGAAIGLVGVLAALSRLHPAWFPAVEAARFQDIAETRLNYPLNYWNGLASMMAMGIPLLLSVAVLARSLVGRALAAAAVPVLVLVAYLTFSRGGAIEVAVGVVAFLVLTPRRLVAAPILATIAAGSTLLVVATHQRPLVEAIVRTDAAQSQADELLLVAIVICVGTALLTVGLTLAERAGTLRMPVVSRRRAVAALLAVVLLAVVGFIAVGGPGEASDRFEQFKSPVGISEDASRFESANGSGRWQFWGSAADAGQSEPLIGIGPGTYEYWWARNGDLAGFVRDAHSMYLETFAELGAVGLAALVAFLMALLFAAGRRLSRAPDTDRALLAAGVATMLAFIVAAGIDWVWELAVIPVAFLLVSAAVLMHRSGNAAQPRQSGLSAPVRIATVAASVAAIAVITLPMSSTKAVRASQEAVTGADTVTALEDAETAAQIQPYAASPKLQKALVLEVKGSLAAAESAATQATVEEPTNWRPWFVLARIRAQAGDAEGAVTAFERAKQLNPRSPLFDGSAVPASPTISE